MTKIKLPQNIEIKQRHEALEIISGFETKNKYDILDNHQQNILFAYEESGFLWRWFMKRQRKLQVHIVDLEKKDLITIKRDWYFLKPKHEILDENGHVLGKIIQEKIHFIRIKYHIYDAHNQFLFTCEYNLKDFKKFKLKDPKFSYRIAKDGQTLATITRKYGLKQIAISTISDANNLFVDFMDVKDEKKKKLILAAAFALDLHVWER